MKFDQILTKSDQILFIHVKNHKIHVKTNQKCNFLKIKKKQRQKSPRKKSTSKTSQGLGNWGIGGGN